MVASDKTWEELADKGNSIVQPFESTQCTRSLAGLGGSSRAISSGLSSAGYDIKLSAEGIKLFQTVHGQSINPKRFNASVFLRDRLPEPVEDGIIYRLPPYTYALGASSEYIRIPRDYMSLCIAKSTYARCGLLVNTTPLEPEWEGVLTIELANLSNSEIEVYSGEGIAQLLLFKLDQDCQVSYADRSGKYQKQKGITLPRA